MKKLSFLGLPASVAEIHVKLDAIQKFLSEQDNDSKSKADPDPDWDYFPSRAAVAEFFEVPDSTVRSWERSGRIKGEKHGSNIRYYIPAILEAVEKDDIIGYYAARLSEKYPPAKETEQPAKEPEISIKTELFPKRFTFIDVGYQGWKATVVCSPDLWDNQKEIRALVYEVILAQHDRKPFKIAPLW
jgi:hypothetical protein